MTSEGEPGQLKKLQDLIWCPIGPRNEGVRNMNNHEKLRGTLATGQGFGGCALKCPYAEAL